MAKRQKKTQATRSAGHCELPRVDARKLTWSAFKKDGWRGSIGVILTGLFDSGELLQWQPEAVIASHGNESFNAHNDRGRASFPTLSEYLQGEDPESAIFTTDSLSGLFGKAFYFASQAPNRTLLRDFTARPVFSIGLQGTPITKHDGHWETWHALLQGSKAWWLGPPSPPDASVWDQPCNSPRKRTDVPSGIHFCVQRAGEVIYFGEGVAHSNCMLEPFTFGVGAQGHTESWPPLLRAVNRGDSTSLKAYARKRADVGTDLAQVSGAYNRTALHHAALHGYSLMIAQLLALRGDPDKRDRHGLTPIFLAAFSGHIQAVEELASSGMGLKAGDAKGAQALQWAATQGHYGLVEFLVEKQRMDVRAQDSAGGGSVSAAATMGHVRILEYLQKHGAELEEIDNDGMTPLHFAAGHGHRQTTAFLLNQSARSTKSHSGHLPLDIARGSGHTHVVKLFQSRSKKKKNRRQRTSRREL